MFTLPSPEKRPIRRVQIGRGGIELNIKWEDKRNVPKLQNFPTSISRNNCACEIACVNKNDNEMKIC